MRRIVLVVGFLVLFAGAAFAQLPGNVPRNETLIVDQLTGRVGTPSNFNLWSGWRWQDRGLQQLVCEPLWTVDYATGEIICGSAAELPQYNEDFTKMTIKLRQGIYWSDGVPFTADDVVYTIDIHVKTPGLLYHGPMAEFVDKVYKTDDYTVVVELKKPNSRFHAHFLDRWGCLRIMPKHIFEKVEDPVTFEFNPPVGCGPYKLLDYDPAGFWTLWERREDWQRTPTGMLYGEPKPKYVLFQAFETEEAKILAMLRHELDMAQFAPEGLRVVLERSETTRAWRKEWPWVVNIDPCITGIIFNNMVEPYNIRDVRWALALAIDIVDYMATAFDLMAPVSPIHLPPVPAYIEAFFNPMEEWLKNFELDLGNGEKFKPFDPEVPQRIAIAAKERGYPVPEDPKVLRELFGIGWWKYAPDVAEKLLKKHGFTKGADGKWYLPNGQPWKISIVTDPNPAHHHYRNAMAAAEQWRRFGIDATVNATEAFNSLHLMGEFEVGTMWPAAEPWGAGVDLSRTLDPWRSSLVVPIGQAVTLGPGGAARWSNPRLDEVIAKLEATDPFADIETTRLLGIEALKIVVEEMPTIPTYGYCGAVAWDEYYWENYPGAENSYTQPYQHWPNFKYMLPFLKPKK
ncbi:MAG: ABC transporter substrate-binding protein [Candidatus Caldatribacterium sp.]|nr:ABC transporter substrate-binding protein [Candidatus Caldatribacterium sp.]MDW8082116.1 ABC transporter substrate-binding protein [Candidatus Calescibacterium sp.]